MERLLETKQSFLQEENLQAAQEQISTSQKEQPSSATNHLRALLELKWGEIETEALELLQELLRTDTRNFEEEGTEIKAVAILQSKFDEVGILYEVVEPKPGRGNIVARVPGDGSSGKGALLLSAHLDTVYAPKENWAEEGWKHDPFGGEIDEEDGCLYGRGAIDMKHMAALSVTLLCFIQKSGVKLSRDLIFAGLADEERTGSAYGVKYLIDNHPELVEADVVFNEAGGFSLFFAGKETFAIQIAEKGICRLQLTVRGQGGHASVYNKDNPIAKLGAVAYNISNVRLPVRINDYNTASIEAIASLLPFPSSIIFRHLLSPYYTDYILDNILPEEQANTFGPFLRNTANPTIIGGGDQPNQIPSSAWMTVNGRILPGSTVDDVVEDVKQLIGVDHFEPKQGPNGEEIPPEITLEVSASREPYGEDLNNTLFKEVLAVIRETVAEYANGAPTLPLMNPASTDSFHYSRNPRRKPVCLGFTPVRFPPGVEFSKLFHGVNECIPVEGFKWGLHVLADVVFKLCDAAYI